MIRTISIVLVGLFAACATNTGTTPGTDPLAGENGQDGEESKADSVHDNFTFVAVHKNAVLCGNPILCTPYVLTRVNRTSMVCNDGKAHANCQVHGVNFSKFSQDTQDKVNAAIENETSGTANGVQVIVKGQFKIYVDFLAFEASEVWLAQMDGGSTDGTWVRVSDNGRRCIDAPCHSILEERLNSNRSLNIDGLDFGNSAYDALQQAVDAQMVKPDGAIVVGTRSNGTLMHLPTTLRAVDQVFLPLK